MTNNVYTLVFLTIIIWYMFIYNSFQLKKMSLLIYENSLFSFIPFCNIFIFCKILEEYLPENKLINKFTKYILALLPTTIVVPYVGIILSAIDLMILWYLRFSLFKKYDNRKINYIWSIVLPGVIYKKCFENILVEED